MQMQIGNFKATLCFNSGWPRTIKRIFFTGLVLWAAVWLLACFIQWDFSMSSDLLTTLRVVWVILFMACVPFILILHKDKV